MRILIKLVILALAGYGAYKLYEEYGNRAPASSAPHKSSGTVLSTVAHRAADTLSASGAEAANAYQRRRSSNPTRRGKTPQPPQAGSSRPTATLRRTQPTEFGRGPPVQS